MISQCPPSSGQGEDDDLSLISSLARSLACNNGAEATCVARSLASALLWAAAAAVCPSHNANVPNAKLLLFPSLKGKPRILVHSIIHLLSVFGRLAQTCIQFPSNIMLCYILILSIMMLTKRVKSYLELEILFEGCSQGRVRTRET